MIQNSFIESIKVKDGHFYNLPAHIERMRNTMQHSYGKISLINISDRIISENSQKELFKCRILYAADIVSIQFTPYIFKRIDTLALVECNEIDYSYKLSDRSQIDSLYRQRGQGSDIIIVKNGYITDTSYTNLVFENEEGFFTPKTYLLNGTKRQLLIKQGKIREKDIRVSDISSYSKVYLINAMIDLEDRVSIPVSKIYASF